MFSNTLYTCATCKPYGTLYLMHKLIVANWKMNPTSKKEAKKIFAGTKAAATKARGVQVVVCPPAVYLPELAKERPTAKVQLGVQDVFHEDAGAFTGQTSVPMVKEYKAKWAIVGHSERRARGETNEVVAEKAQHALRSGLTPIVCVGERERNEEGAYYIYVRAEIEAVLDGLKRKEVPGLVFAYEPIWAIGKRAEEACSTAQLYEMVLFIKKLLIERYGRKTADGVRILYGGSVHTDNAATLMQEGGVDGLLIGRASRDVEVFGEILSHVAA